MVQVSKIYVFFYWTVNCYKYSKQHTEHDIKFYLVEIRKSVGHLNLFYILQVEVFTTSNKKLGDITVDDNEKVKDIKKQIAALSPKLYVDRQSLRAELKGRDIKDDIAVPNLSSTRKIYVKDLGPQIGWSTVFVLEYAGPLVLYGLVSLRPWILYGDAAKGTTLSTTAM